MVVVFVRGIGEARNGEEIGVYAGAENDLDFADAEGMAVVAIEEPLAAGVNLKREGAATRVRYSGFRAVALAAPESTLR